MLKLVGQRRRLLDYLKTKDGNRYKKLIDGSASVSRAAVRSVDPGASKCAWYCFDFLSWSRNRAYRSPEGQGLTASPARCTKAPGFTASEKEHAHLRRASSIGESELCIEVGRLAKQADGSVVVRYGDTMLLVTAVSAREKKDIDFLPLTVEYQEKLYAAGRIPGSFFKREGRLTEKETLTCRLIDRSLPPAVPRRATRTRRRSSPASSPPTRSNEGDIHGITGASAALWSRDIPFNGPIAGVRVGRVDGQFVANPTSKQREQSDIDLVDGRAAKRRHRHGRRRRGGGVRGGHGGRARVRQAGGAAGARAAGRDARAS